jgi:hypothetical protein
LHEWQLSAIQSVEADFAKDKSVTVARIDCSAVLFEAVEARLAEMGEVKQLRAMSRRGAVQFLRKHYSSRAAACIH